MSPKEEERDRLAALLKLELGDRKFVVIYETLDGKSALVTTETDRAYLQAVLLFTIDKLKGWK